MNRDVILVLIFLLFGFAIALFFRVNKNIFINQISSMTLSSPAFSEGGHIPTIYTCKGANINPPLVIQRVSPTAESLVLIMEDPDAPVQTFFHWLMWNIPPKNFVLIEDTLPEGAVQGINNFGHKNYDGPCPASGSHRYIFTLYALDTTLTLPEGTGIVELKQILSDHVIGETQLTGIYP